MGINQTGLVSMELISFGDSSCASARRRLRSQANSSGYFAGVSILNERDLPRDFRVKHKAVLRPGSKGFGYWIWKPRIILDRLSEMDEDSVLLYVDVGCHILPGLEDQVQHLLRRTMASASGILCSEMSFPERHWTKGDVFSYFDVKSNSQITETGQRQGGVVFYRKSPEAIRFLKEWLHTCETRLDLVNDDPSKTPNFPGFIDHRHDQSVFSVLSKLYSVETFPASLMSQWEISGIAEGGLPSFPIETRRDRYSKWNLSRASLWNLVTKIFRPSN